MITEVDPKKHSTPMIGVAGVLSEGEIETLAANRHGRQGSHRALSQSSTGQRFRRRLLLRDLTLPPLAAVVPVQRSVWLLSQPLNIGLTVGSQILLKRLVHSGLPATACSAKLLNDLR